MLGWPCCFSWGGLIGAGRSYHDRRLLDLRGRVLEVEGVRQKIPHAEDKGFARMIVPTCNLEKLEAEGWKDDRERQYVKRSVKGVRTFVDVMEAAVDGEYAVTFPLVVLSRFDT